MSAKHLSKVGSDLVRRCGTRDPFRIAQELGIEVLFCDDFGPLKGMYRVIKRNRFIFINKDLSSRMQRIVCAHELGHDQLHRHLAKGNALQEFMLYDMATKPEYEANIVAAEKEVMLTIKKKFGKNAILKGRNLEEGATAKDRNAQIGGHKA